jgi:diguanylate cyclase (GGDEF)-like protein
MQNTTSVLVIDHDPQDRNLLIHQLRGEGYEVVAAAGYEEGDARFEEGSVDIVIMDLDQDSDAGVALTKDVRGRAGNRPLQIVLTSQNVDDNTLRHGLEVGADDFVGKPLRPLEVTLRVRAAYVRLREELDLYQEREFYRRAAKEEEELSARVLDQNVHLRRAYDRVEERNRDLARMNRQLQRVARYDALSGLMNRTSLFHILDVEMERSARVDAPLCILMIDIDHFKPINDDYGHGCGDEVIRRIGEVLKTERRKYDYCGRYGGEEFLMVLPNTALSDAAVVADRIRERVGELVVVCDNGRGDELSITASVGVARYRESETRDMWIARADRAMYRAKERGRNRVELEVDGSGSS